MKKTFQKLLNILNQKLWSKYKNRKSKQYVKNFILKKLWRE